jgi:transcriptional regulator with GAF, ATPase, and Fis domain
LKKTDRAFALFQKVQEALGHVPNLTQTFDVILDAVIDQMDVEKCSIMLKDPVSGELSLLASRGKEDGKSSYRPDPSVKVNRSRLNEGIAGWVCKKGQAFMFNDAEEEPRFVRIAGLNNDVKSLICLPVRENDQVVGVFNLSHSKKGAFDEGDKLVLAYISNQVGAALTSARFFLEMQEVNRLMRGSDIPFSPRGDMLSSSSASNTFVEVGEMTREKGLFIYASQKMHQIKEIIDQVANTDVTVLIQGESGVGKEVVARSIHLNSSRQQKPFVKVNCAAIPSELLESELFGYEKGAFTGAYRSKPGKFELAHGGTIFLDEIADISPSLQAKLLQVLQDREFSKLGGKRDIRVDVRVLAATNKNIEEAVNSGRFREDLYYRLNVVNIVIPPLRERKEEIPIFIEYFLDKFGKKYRKGPKPLPGSLLNTLLQYHWAGNVRELENIIQRYVLLGNGEGIIEELNHVVNHQKKQEDPEGCPSLREIHHDAVTKAEADVIRKALEMTNWNRKKAASVLNISYKALLMKIKKYAIGHNGA